MKKIFFMWVVFQLAIMSGCSSKVELPKAVLGEWQQADDPSFFLKFEQKGYEGKVSLWFIDGWSLPFKIKQNRINNWSFKNDSYNVISHPKYATDANGTQLWVLEQTELSRGRTVELKLKDGQLIAFALWQNIKNEEWDFATKKPKKQKISLLHTNFNKVKSFPDIPEMVLVKGTLMDSNGSPIIGAQVFVVPYNDGKWNESSDNPSSKSDTDGRFSISVTHSFFEKTWRNGFHEFILSYAEEGTDQQLVSACSSKTVPFKLESGIKEIVLGDVNPGKKEIELDDFPFGAEPTKALSNVEFPKLLKKVDPIYPESARKAGVEGIVVLQATINTEGKVVSTKILSSIPLLDQAAIDAVRQWIYKPMEVNNKPKSGIVQIKTQFKIE
jgi:TonB family protein